MENVIISPTSATFILGLVIGVFMVGLTVLIHYETFSLTNTILSRLHFMHNRLKLLVVMVAIFAAHTVEVWLYAACYFFVVQVWPLGTLQGEMVLGFMENYVYYSASVYTTVGFGDIFPQGAVRAITSIEAMNGLVLIGWSASYTYLAMERFWKLPRK